MGFVYHNLHAYYYDWAFQTTAFLAWPFMESLKIANFGPSWSLILIHGFLSPGCHGRKYLRFLALGQGKERRSKRRKTYCCRCCWWCCWRSKRFGRRRRGTTKKEIISGGNTFCHWRWSRMEKEKEENISWKKYGEGTGAKYWANS